MSFYREYDNSRPRFALDTRKPRVKITCPSCGKQKCFTPYVDVTTGEMVGPEFGVCDHIKKCGYKRYPTGRDIKGADLFVTDKDVMKGFDDPMARELVETLDYGMMMETLSGRKSVLESFLSWLFGEERARRTAVMYKLGTTTLWNWKDCAVYWQIDKDWRIRTGKIMEYAIRKDDEGNPIDVKRVKEPMDKVYWAHCLKGQDFALRQCLFGEHLLNYFPDGYEVNIVESEKTAIICNMAKPKSLFMATGGLYNIRLETMEILRGRKITLFPDKGEAFERWKEKARLDLHGLDVTISDYVERHKDFPEGADIGDIIISEEIRKKKNK